MLKTKLTAQLKAKYSGAPNLFIEKLAAILTAQVSTEEEIEGKIAELDNSLIPIADFINFNQSDGDRRVTEALANTAARKAKEEPLAPEPKAELPSADDEGMLARQVALLQKNIEDMQSLKKKEDAGAALRSKLAELKIPAEFAALVHIESAEQLDTLLPTIQTAFQAASQHLNNGGLGEQPKPGGGASAGKVGEADMVAFFKGLPEKI